MRQSNNRAFKEWAVVCQALAHGRQVLILRKGGITEARRGFKVTDHEFFLFPTYSHQSPENVVPEWREALSKLVEPETGSIVLSHYAVVTSSLRIEDLGIVRALRGNHIWSDEVVCERFHRWAKDGLFALILRVHELAHPALLEMREEYTGCKSWVTLAEEIPLSGIRPVLSDEEFRQQLNRLMATVPGFMGISE